MIDADKWPSLHALRMLWSMRRYHYNTVFSRDPETDAAQRAGSAKSVLMDLARYCHAASPTHNEREQGRRDVWIYLSRLLRLSEEELAMLYSEAPPEVRYQIHNPGPTYTTEGA